MGLPKKPIHDAVSGKYWASVTECACDIKLSGQHVRYIMKNKNGHYTDNGGTEYKLEYTDHVPQKEKEKHPIMDYPEAIMKSWSDIKKRERNIYYSNIQELAYKMAGRLAELGVTGCEYIEVGDDFYYGDDLYTYYGDDDYDKE